MASIQKQKNSYRITVSCGYDENGKKLFKKVTYKPDLYTEKGNLKAASVIRKEVERYAAQLEKEIKSGQFYDNGNMSITDFADLYIEEYAKPNLAYRTLQSVMENIAMYKQDFGYMKLSAISPAFLQKYANEVAERKCANNPQKTLAYSSVKKKLSTLSSMFTFAVRMNFMMRNPMEAVKIPNKRSLKDEEKIKYFSPEEAQVFVQILSSPLLYEYAQRTRKDSHGNIVHIRSYTCDHSISLQLKFCFYMLIFTGCRRGELISLKWKDLNFEKNTVRIMRSLSEDPSAEPDKVTKTVTSVREVSLPTIVVKLAKEWKKKQEEYRFSLGTAWEGVDDSIFIQKSGKRMHPDTPRQAFYRIIENYNATRKENDIELPMVTLHGLRHTCATLLLANGIDVKTVSSRLGHSTVVTTYDIYAHTLRKSDQIAGDALQELLLPAK